MNPLQILIQYPNSTKRTLKSLKTKQMTTLISSPDLNHVTEICERIILFEKGKVIKDIYTDQNTQKNLKTILHNNKQESMIS